MTDRAKFEQMLEYLINEDQQKAEELFHELVVAKSRSIYENLLDEIIAYFQEKINTIGQANVIIDPGFGFAKTSSQNFELLQQLAKLTTLAQPILVGISRKSMIYKSLNISPEEALNGTTALHMAALSAGAQILRVHDVLAAKQCVTLFNLLNN